MGRFRRDILEEHADEAGFLFRQRGRAFRSRLVDVAGLESLDERLRAHLDGLAVAGAEGWKVVAAGLADDDPAQVFVAAATALVAGGEDGRAEVEAALGAPSSIEGLRWSLRLAGAADLPPWLERWTGHPAALGRALACDALAFRGMAPPWENLAALLREESPAVLRLALGAVCRARTRELAPRVLELLADADPGVRASALWAATALGRAEAIGEAGRRCDGEGADAEAAVQCLGLAGDEPSLDSLRRALGGPQARLATLALGRLGYPAAIEPLLEAAGKEPLARAAGLALCWILGLDLRAQKLELAPEQRPRPADELALDPDEDLPWPDPERLIPVAREAAGGVGARVRLRGGAPWSVAALEPEIMSGCLPDREAALRERYLRDPQAAWCDPRGWAGMPGGGSSMERDRLQVEQNSSSSARSKR